MSSSQKELNEPRDKVARAGDGVLAGALHGHVAPTRGEEGGGTLAHLGQLTEVDSSVNFVGFLSRFGQ